MRRTLPVPIDGDCPSIATRSSTLATVAAFLVPLASGSSRTGNTTASSGSSRGRTPAMTRPSGRIAGMSLLLCTARSTSRRSSASSISFTNSRLPPTSDSGASCSRSPDVRITTISHGGPPAAAMRAATVFACHNASWLPRVPSRSVAVIVARRRDDDRRSRRSPRLPSCAFAIARERLHFPPFVFGEREQPRQRLGVHRHRLGIGQRLELFGWREQQLLDNQVGDLVDARACFRRQRRQLEIEPFELGAADRFEPFAQRH